MATQLKVIKSDVLSFVENPSNQKWFYVTKEEDMENFESELREVFPPTESFKDAEDSELEEEVKSATETVKKWEEDLPDEFKSAMGVILRTSTKSEDTNEVDDTELKLLHSINDRLDEFVEKQELELDELVEAIADLLDVPASDVWEELAALLPEDYGYPEPEEDGQKDEEEEEDVEKDEAISDELAEELQERIVSSVRDAITS